MEYYYYLVFIVALSAINLLTLGVITILDYFSVASTQKIKILRMTIIMIVISPIIFIILRFFSYQAISMTLPDSIINPSIMQTKLTMLTAHSPASYYIFIAYISGFIFMLLRISFSYVKAIIYLIASEHKIIQGQSVFIHKKISSPFNFGLFKPKIYVPHDFEQKWSTREIELSLAHEQVHVKNSDALWKILSLIVQSILFFAPWVYLLHKKFELNMEIQCDKETRVITKSNINEYGNLLLAMVCHSRNIIFTHIATSTLKRRFIAMKLKTKEFPIAVLLFSIFLMFTGATVVLAAGGMNNKTTFDITSEVLIDGKLISKPRMIVNENQLGTIAISNKDHSNELKMSVIASRTATKNKKAINISFDVQYKNAKETLHIKPRLIVESNQPSKIRIQLDTGHSCDLVILAKENDLTA